MVAEKDQLGLSTALDTAVRESSRCAVALDGKLCALVVATDGGGLEFMALVLMYIHVVSPVFGPT